MGLHLSENSFLSNTRTKIKANLEPVRLETVLTESVSLPHGRDTNRTEAICDLPPVIAGDVPRWLVLYDGLGVDRRDGEPTIFGNLPRQD